MNWTATTVGLLLVGMIPAAAFFASACFFATKRRDHRFGPAMTVLMGLCGVMLVFLNPLTNVPIALTIDDIRLDSARRLCLSQPERVLYQYLGTPDHSSTNERGKYVTYDNTSVFFSMYRQGTMALVSNGVIVGVWNDD
jgi:hypothetical protein